MIRQMRKVLGLLLLGLSDALEQYGEAIYPGVDCEPTRDHFGHHTVSPRRARR